jgi:hypothetical protein
MYVMAVAVCFLSCSNPADISGQPETVRATDPAMNSMEMLSMTQQPGWQLLAGTQWVGTNYIVTVKGVNEKMNAGFMIDLARNYTQSAHAPSGSLDGNSVYLNLMSAADYLDYVFRRQFPNVKGARRTELKTLDRYSAAERQELEQQRVAIFNRKTQENAMSGNSSWSQIANQTADRSSAEYRWVQNGDTMVHVMEATIFATYMNFFSQYGNSSVISWTQGFMYTVTMPSRHVEKAGKDIAQMIPTMQFNQQYMAALSAKNQAGEQRNYAEANHIRGEMAQSAARHQQRMSQILAETGEYVANTRREVLANRQASQERINRGWRDAVVGVDRYMGVDGKVVEVPVSMSSQVWQSADGGTVYTSDSYLFNPVASLPDRDGVVRDFRQLQLLK